MRQQRRILTVVTCAAVVMLTPAARAADIYDSANSAEYGRKFGGMLGRGAINVLTSWVDLLVQTVNETKNGPAFIGTMRGIGQGAGCSVLRLGSGAVDIVTSWVPGFNGFPVARSYEDCLEQHAQVRASTPTTYIAPELPAIPATPVVPAIVKEPEPKYSK